MNFAGTSTLLSRAAFALCALLAAGNGLVPQARAQDATNKLEAVDVQTLPGQQLQLKSLAGKPTLINLWATWCAPCIVELPTLNAISNRADLNLRVVTISQDLGDPAKVQQFLDQRGFAQLPAWIDTKGDLAVQYGVQTLPTTIFYDAQGREVWRYVGGHDWSSPETQNLLSEGGA